MGDGPSEPTGADERGLDVPAAVRLLRALGETGAGEPGPAVEEEGAIERRVGAYTVVEEIGRGATGTVYRVHGRGLDRALALKLFHEPLGGGRAERVWRELHVLEGLALPVLPRLIDYDVHEGRLYLVTDYIPGLDLEEHCRAAGLDVRARAEVLARVAEAVQMLHEYGVIHRDIKPANVRVTARGDVVLLDLGLAALATGDPVATLTAEGQPLGTPAYMAPEQARGERAALSIRADVWGLGATAWKVLVGETPFDLRGLTLHAAVARVAGEEPRRAREVATGMPKRLAAVLGKACERDSGRRYATAGEFAADLRRWIAGEPVQAAEPGRAARCGRWMARHPAWSTALACGAIAALSLLLTWVSVWWLDRAPYRLDWERGEDHAVLRARSGKPLQTWKLDEKQSYMMAIMTDDVIAPWGERLVILGATGVRGPCVHAFRVGHPELEVWHSECERPARFPTGKDGPALQARAGQIVDVFAESPGPELVVAHFDAAGGSGVVRVYELGSGRVLYEAWHPGWLYGVRWLAGPRVLVLCGVNDEANWAERGYPGWLGDDGRTWPAVVMGITPQFGRVGVRLLPPGSKESEGARPLWYRCILPPEEAPGEGMVQLMKPGPGYGDERDCTVLGIGPVWFVLDGAGNDRKVVMSYARQSADISQKMLDSLRLGDLPRQTKK